MQVVISRLSKVFGPEPEQTLRLIEAGHSRQEAQAKTGGLAALHDISLHVAKGETLVLMGLSGSGKSTLARCLNYLVVPTSGEVRIDGTDLASLSPKELRSFRQRKTAMVFQNFALFPHRNVLANVGYGLELAGCPRAAIQDAARNALDQVGLSGWETSFPHELSGGMRQRVGLARALALDPEILIMDEAFSALDPLTRRDMQDELIRLQDDLKKTVVFISHDLDEALKLGDRIILLREGQIVQEGTPEDFLTSPADEYVARFIEGADLSRVLTAQAIMRPSAAVAILDLDGPRTALRKMRANSITSLFVLHRSCLTLAGLINADDAHALALDGGRDLRTILRTDVATVSLDTPAAELIPIMAEATQPLAVIDAKNRLAGVIVRGSLLGALAETRGSDT